MKHFNLSFLLTVLMSMVGAKVLAYAYYIAVANDDGVIIYYGTNNDTELSVVNNRYYDKNSNEYSGNVVIPASVNYNGKEYSVTRIEGNAFQNCSGLTSITIPNSVTSTGAYAFDGCSGLKKVIVKDLASWCKISFSVTVGNPLVYAHHLYSDENTEISDLIIPNSVTSISARAFNGCSGLTSVTIGNSVESIGELAFYGCSGLTAVKVVSGNTKYDSRNNCNAIIETASNTLIAGCKNTIIPNSVTSIGNRAFGGCSGLTSITIPNSVTSISDGAFMYCSGLPSVTIPNSVESIGDGAFYGCSGLTSVTIGNSVTSISARAFYGCSGLTSVTIPNSVTSIGERAFYNTRLKSVTIGSGDLSIATNAFSYYDSSSGAKPVKVIWLTNTPPTNYSDAAGTVNYVANNQYSLSNMTVYPFLSSMFEVDGVKYVPVSPSERTCDAIDCAYDASAENIHIGNTINNKGISLTVKEVKPYTCYENIFIKDVNLSFGGNIGSYAFYGCTGINTATISNQGNIGSYAFQGCTSINTVTVSNQGAIGDYAFQYNTGMTTATLGESITSIGKYAFDGCTKLQSIDIPNSVQSIGSYAFSGCSAMQSAKIGTGVTAINTNTYSGCSSLTDIQIGSNVKTIGSYAFENCTSLANITIPKAVTSIGNYTFYGCTALKNVIMEDSGDDTALSLGSTLFSSCPLDYVYIGRNISYNKSSSKGSPFYRNTSLRSVEITDRETEILENEFYGCTNLKNIKMGNDVTKIGNRAFSDCSSLESFIVGPKVNSIGQEAFSGCEGMTTLVSRNTEPPVCESQALNGINKWNCKLYIPTGAASAYQNADQWKEFFFVEEGDPTPIERIEADAEKEAEIIGIYDLNGTKKQSMQRGLNIIRMSNGTTRKIAIK